MPRRSARSERSTASPDLTPMPIKTKKNPSKKDTTAGKRSVTSSGIFVIGKGDDDEDVVTRRRNTSSVDSSTKHQKQQHQEEEDEEEEDEDEEDEKDEEDEEEENICHPEGALLAHLPPAARFVAAEVITLVLLAAGRRVQMTLPPLTVSLAGWRAVETALAWRAGLEPVDIGLAALIAYAPVPWLMVVFYGVSPAVASFAVAVDVLSPLVGFYLVGGGGGGGGRKLNEKNKDKDKNTPTMDERIIVSLLATAVYAATISLALRNILPRVFVLDFAGIPTVEPAYGASFAGVVPLAAAFGLAVCEFVYTASFRDAVVVGDEKDKDKDAEEVEERIRRFNPVDASLGETLWWNLCGYSRRARAVWARAALVTVMTAVGTYLACRDGVDGVTCWGAVAYAAVWAVATAATGLALGLVGRD